MSVPYSDVNWFKYDKDLTAFIDKIKGVKDYLNNVGYDIKSVKNEFMTYLVRSDLKDIYKYTFIIDGGKFNPLCDILRMFKE